jgi:predicted AlkP superfamily pyrophosphatase or phosphodiesterase
MMRIGMASLGAVLAGVAAVCGQTPQRTATEPAARVAARPKLVVMIVVDQMRGDYVDRFHGQWSGGLQRLVNEGAWFRAAAYPYATTETCVGHATISTGAFPSSHGLIANSWWDREQQKMVTCTSDPNVKNVAYAGATAKGGDSAWRMQLPAYAEELKFQGGGATRVVTFSLKARAAITLAGHTGDAVTWFDGGNGAWVTSSVYGTLPFLDDFLKQHPAAEDFGKTWALSLPGTSYWYQEKTAGAVPPEGWSSSFPHVLGGKQGSTGADETFYEQWQTSPFSEAYLTKLAITAVDRLGLGQRGATDYLGVSYSSVDYVGHAFGPRSREIQDMLLHLDRDLGELFTHLDRKVGRANYVVALSGDHGVVPIPEEMQTSGFPAGVLHLAELKDRLEKALEPFEYSKPAIQRVSGSDIYFSPGIYGRLRQDPAAMRTLVDAAQSEPGVAAVYRAEDLRAGNPSVLETRTALELSYFAGRSGDLFVLPKPYWLLDGTPEGKAREYATGHGTPYNYDQHVPVFLMGYGIQPGAYFTSVTPADIAPTLASLTAVTLATRDGRVLQEALRKRETQ